MGSPLFKVNTKCYYRGREANKPIKLTFTTLRFVRTAYGAC